LPIDRDFIPFYAVHKFAEDTKWRGRRRTLLVQLLGNKVDSINLRVPCDFKRLRIYHELNFTF